MTGNGFAKSAQALGNSVLQLGPVTMTGNGEMAREQGYTVDRASIGPGHDDREWMRSSKSWLGSLVLQLGPVTMTGNGCRA